MKKYRAKKILLIVLSFLASFIVLKYEITSLHTNQWFLFDFFDILIYYGLGILIAIPTLIYSIKFYKLTDSRTFKIPLIIIGITTISVLLLLSIGKTKNNSPIILKAYYNGDTNGISLQLREDSTYKLEDLHIFGGDFTEGNYRIEKDTIYLEKDEPLGNDFMSRKLILKPTKILFHIDNDGNYDSGYFSMKIIDRVK